jgi:hypothetical protein
MGINLSANSQPNPKSKTFQNSKNMDISKLTNETVKQAIEALQESNKTAWFSFFTTDAVFTDDGNTLDLKSFFENALNHKEKFITIDKVENEGKDITGDFFAGQWGTFKVFFKFHINTEGKINRLDIGQTK